MGAEVACGTLIQLIVPRLMIPWEHGAVMITMIPWYYGTML